MKRYLGIDIGTTSLKAAVFDENGKRLALRSVDYKLDTDAKSGYIEFDADKYFFGFGKDFGSFVFHPQKL